MTIDELARRTRTTTRTLRLYQTKALLPPPRIVGRVGYYTELHVNRLLLIERLQGRGFSLAGIAELFKMWQEGKGLDELFGFEAKLVQPWNEEESEEFSAQEFEARWPDLYHDQDLLGRVVQFGVVERLEGDQYRVLSPVLMAFGQEMVSKGVPIDRILAELEQLREDSRRIAQRFMDMFRTYVLPSMVQGGPMEWLPRLANNASHMRPAVRNMMLSVFMSAMDEEIRGFTSEANVEPSLEEEPIPDSEPSQPSDPPPLKSAASG
jgi:DNA-binding transcriptional MerR regulator